MRILSKYILSEFTKPALLAVVFIVTLYVIVNFFEKVEDFIAFHVDPYDVILYYLLKIPHIFFLMVPYPVLFATAACIGSLSRHSEITAMRAGGISLLSLAAPILLASFFIAILTITFNEYVVPYANLKHRFIHQVDIYKNKFGPVNSAIHGNEIWHRSKENSLWNIEHFDSKNKIFRGVHIYFYEDGKSLSKRIDASSATHNGKYWVFEDVYLRHFKDFGQSEIKFFKRAQFPFDERPSDFHRLNLDQDEMSIRKINWYRQQLRKEGLDSTRYDVDFHYKIAYPFVCVIMAFIGIPLSLRLSRSGGIMFSVGLSAGIGWVYFYLYSMGISLGHEGILPPWLSAWGLNIIAVAIGSYMILTIDTDVSAPFSKS